MTSSRIKNPFRTPLETGFYGQFLSQLHLKNSHISYTIKFLKMSILGTYPASVQFLAAPFRGTLALSISLRTLLLFASKICCGIFAYLTLSIFFSTSATAAKIGDVVETNAWEQAAHFFSFQEHALQDALAGSLLLGLSCGLLGCFIVVRKMALVGDTLSHAVLPGIALGFLWNNTKDPLAILIGASAVGLFGILIVGWIQETTKLKEDSALGLVLSSFYAVGICLITMIQRLPTGNKSGIDKFLFGQAAALNREDITLMLITTGLTVIAIALFYKELLLTSFDSAFASSLGLPVKLLNNGLMMLVAFSVVVAMQAVGVVLVSAMLIIPAAAAYLLTDRLHWMLLLSASFGMLAGALGAFFSFLENNLPTGPFMVLGATSIFFLAFCFGWRHGLITRWWHQLHRSRRIRQENTLKSIYRILENRNFEGSEGIGTEELAQLRRETIEDARKQAIELKRAELVTLDMDLDAIYLTPLGFQKACVVVRNHRLWELYLTSAANYGPDHVHEDAEKIEHALGEEIVRQLERRLHYPHLDPHGKVIPSLRDMGRLYPSTKPSSQSAPIGYG